MTLKHREWYRWMMPIFLHGSLLHILTTVLCQFIIVSIVEKILTLYKAWKIYVLSGVAGILFGCLINDNLSVGASASNFGLCGAFVIFCNKLDRMDNTELAIIRL